jgi:hypothetical protein
MYAIVILYIFEQVSRADVGISVITRNFKSPQGFDASDVLDPYSNVGVTEFSTEPWGRHWDFEDDDFLANRRILKSISSLEIWRTSKR